MKNLPLVVLAVLTSLAVVACKGTTRSDDAGSVSVAVQLANGTALNSVSYSITGPSMFLKTGTVDVSGSTTIAATVGPIPAGAGYSIALSGTTSDGSTSCAGSGTFTVVAHQVASVAVHLSCQQASHTGSVLVNGTLNVCPTIDGTGASPAEVLVGSAIGVSAQAHDADNGPSPLAYQWTASSGVLTDASSPNPRFTCTAPGTVTLTLTVSDGDPAATCGDTTTMTVNCTASTGANACRLGGGAVKHVIYIQFDNTHLTRDRAAVPSDLEQMPHLLNFIRGNGTMMANDHTILISHTAGGILSSLTGVYPDRHGQTVSNSYVRTNSTGGFSFPSSFGYWTDPTQAGTTVPNMVQPDGTNMPAPWAPYTRAGCDVGAVASANIVLENTGTGANGDVTTIFGSGSPQFTEATASAAAGSGTAARNLAQTNLVGFAVHCAQGSATCAPGVADNVTTEPGGYSGFKALFGAEQVNPLLTGHPFPSALTGLDGQPIVDPFGQPGFPGFDGMSAAASLAYVAAMQEKGIPVTYAYISDAHDFHGVAGNAHTAYGPGSAGYVAQLKSYDDAFAAFFNRLAADGIDKTNTLFVFTVDEGDHFAGGTPTPVNCDGVNVPCDWTNQVGEINANIDTLVQNEFPTLASRFLGSAAPNAFTVHGDDAPTFYLAKKGTGGGPLAQTDPDTRSFEQQIANLTAVNPYTGNTDHVMYKM
ncbi:MAG: PKD domain-containing protein, partial [Verrucomicrobiota bacterium]